MPSTRLPSRKSESQNEKGKSAHKRIDVMRRVERAARALDKRSLDRQSKVSFLESMSISLSYYQANRGVHLQYPSRIRQSEIEARAWQCADELSRMLIGDSSVAISMWPKHALCRASWLNVLQRTQRTDTYQLTESDLKQASRDLAKAQRFVRQYADHSETQRRDVDFSYIGPYLKCNETLRKDINSCLNRLDWMYWRKQTTDILDNYRALYRSVNRDASLDDIMEKSVLHLASFERASRGVRQALNLKSTAGEDARSCLQNLATLSEQTAREFAKLRHDWFTQNISLDTTLSTLYGEYMGCTETAARSGITSDDLDAISRRLDDIFDSTQRTADTIQHRSSRDPVRATIDERRLLMTTVLKASIIEARERLRISRQDRETEVTRGTDAKQIGDCIIVAAPPETP